MPYPIVSEDSAKGWFNKWQDACEEASARVSPMEAPKVEKQPIGDEFDWEMEIQAIVDSLATLLDREGEKAFESKGAVLLHKALPDHEALRDPEFWYWFATVPGRALVESRYPFKEKTQAALELEDGEGKKPNFLPGRNNFVGQHAKEVLFFRLWIRAEMGRLADRNGDAAGVYEYASGGSVEFWRSHLLRVLYAQHRPFLQAFVDFQFPGPDRDKPRLTIPEIRQLAKDLAKACANVSVELLDRNQSRAFIERVWTRTSSARAWVKS